MTGTQKRVWQRIKDIYEIVRMETEPQIYGAESSELDKKHELFN